jgi:hypothetical protein
MLLVLMAVAAVAMTGCKEKEPVQPAEPAQVKVTPENLDTELNKMEADIEADIAAEQ